MPKTPNSRKIIAWGTFDDQQPRIKILLEGINNRKDTDLKLIHKNLWTGFGDKSKAGKSKLFQKAWRALCTYPPLLIKYIFSKKHDYVLLSYPGVVDLLMIYPWAKLKGAKIVWDIFVPLYDCIVNDRQLLKPKSFKARLIYFFEKLALKLSDIRILDTQAHSRYIQDQYKLPDNSILSTLVGAEDIFWETKPKTPSASEKFKIIFWGKFIPLQGVEIIVEAATKLQNHPEIEFAIIGTGQKSDQIDNIITSQNLKNIERIDWLNYNELIEKILDADICLGIFGKTNKANKVIPNKLYQAIALGKPVITAQSEAIQELPSMENIHLTQPYDADSLANKILELKRLRSLKTNPYPQRIDKDFVAREFVGTLKGSARKAN